jgi:hypothetical protein
VTALYWVPTLVFLVHIAEELPRFPAWATRHFAATSRAWYVYSHVVLIALVVTISAQAEAAAPRTLWPLIAVGFQWALGVNALFHIATTVLFKEYSPGLVTGVLVCIPATAYVSRAAVAGQLLTTAQLGSAVGLGIIINLIVISSLWLPTDLDWKLRPGRP